MSEATGAKMAATEAAAHQYSINPGLSRFTVRVSAAGMLSSFGHNPNIAIRGYTGELTVNPDQMQQASVRITIPANSLEVTDDISQKDKTDIETKMRQEVLEAQQYPQIVFESIQIAPSSAGGNSYAVTGNLTLRGATRPETITAQVAISGDTIRAYGEFTLRQSDYGIKLVSVAAGALKVKDEVKLTFDISARKQ
ncbi:MAG TPA: YceI family protein [Candidatus Acidoferrales bacterium]